MLQGEGIYDSFVPEPDGPVRVYSLGDVLALRVPVFSRRQPGAATRSRNAVMHGTAG